MIKLFLIIPLFYLAFVVAFISFAEIHEVTTVYADYVPTPHFTQNTPSAFKQLFFSVAHDGENVISPSDSIKSNSQIIFHGDRDVKEVALTFDADMTPWMKEQLLSGKVQSYYNQQLIQYLEQTHTKATLFLTGMWIELYPQAASELASESLFELGNHSYSHPSFSGTCYGLAQITQDEKQPEIEKTQQLLFNLTQKRNTLFRFPGGCYAQDDLALLQKDNIQAIQWDVVGDDGFNDDTQSIVDNVLNNVHNGSIIVMHMNGAPNDPRTTDAIPTIVETLKQQGYTFVTVGELLSPPQNLSQTTDILQYLKNYGV